jgi:hypothetical protein
MYKGMLQRYKDCSGGITIFLRLINDLISPGAAMSAAS